MSMGTHSRHDDRACHHAYIGMNETCAHIAGTMTGPASMYTQHEHSTHTHIHKHDVKMAHIHKDDSRMINQHGIAMKHDTHMFAGEINHSTSGATYVQLASLHAQEKRVANRS